jgi:DNA-binding SARP family transcriptional activator
MESRARQSRRTDCERSGTRRLDASAAGIRLRVLGEVEAAGERGTFAPGRARPGAVLALLAIHGGDPVSPERLADELWTGAAASGAAGVKRVQVNVLRLRRTLAGIAPGVDPGTVIRTRSWGYSLDVDAERVDAVRFARLVDRGRLELEWGDAGRADVTLSEALGLWRGEVAYADYCYESFAAAEIRRLEELRGYATESWVEARLQLGRHASMIAELERLVARDPLRERLRAQLMVALYRCSRQADALAAYQAARTVLVDRLGVEPGRELRGLQDAILAQSPALELAGGPGRPAAWTPWPQAQAA